MGLLWSIRHGYLPQIKLLHIVPEVNDESEERSEHEQNGKNDLISHCLHEFVLYNKDIILNVILAIDFGKLITIEEIFILNY
jgi:hypothetical protein